MTVSKAQQRATAKYEAKVYDKLLLRLPKGQKDTIQAHAAAREESVNGFINRAIAEAIEASKNPFILDERSTYVMGGEEYDIYYRKRIDEALEPGKDKADTDTQ